MGNLNRKNKNSNNKAQALLLTLKTPAENQSASVFSMDLARAFLQSNTALHKINHPSVMNFIRKYTKFAAPSETALRQKCIPEIYKETIDRMKQIAAGKYFWVSIDEAKDCEQRCVAN